MNICNPIPCGCSETDLIYFQFREPDYLNNWNSTPLFGWSETQSGNWLASFVVQTPGTCCVIDFENAVVEAIVGIDPITNQTYQNIVLNAQYLPETFFIQFVFNTGGSTYSKYTQWYKKVNCNTKTVKLQGLFTETDCDKRYYKPVDTVLSLNGTNLVYSNEMRVEGEFKYIGESIAIERTNKKFNSVTVRKKEYQLTLRSIPPFMAERVANICTAKKILIDNVEYLFEGEFSKNNVIGDSFHLVLKFSSPDCEIKHEC